MLCPSMPGKPKKKKKKNGAVETTGSWETDYQHQARQVLRVYGPPGTVASHRPVRALAGGRLLGRLAS
jgi:hypothetical protein